MNSEKITAKPRLPSLVAAMLDGKSAAPAASKASSSDIKVTTNPEKTDHLAIEALIVRSENGIFIAHVVLAILGAVAFLYFARGVVMPVVLAVVAGTALKPLMRWLSYCHVPAPLGAALVLAIFMIAATMGFIRLSRPAMTWMSAAPWQVSHLRQRMQKLLHPAAQLSQVAAVVNNLGTADPDQQPATVVQVKDNHAAGDVIIWTQGLLVSIGETLVLLYLLLASGDLFLQKLVRILPTLSDKRRAVEFSTEIQQNISNYLFAVSLINVGLGIAVSLGLYFLGVPNAAMWGTLAALLNYIPYFGPIFGIILLGIVGLVTFDTLPQGLLPLAWYLLLHLLEANLITPILLGRRFTLNPVVIFISLIFWTWLWGVPGALLSVPILICLKAFCDRMPALAPVSEFLVS